jgi:hypothetical protein
VRLVDAMFRGGHLSEGALVEAVMTGERPMHLDRCDICTERAVELNRWLDQVRTMGVEVADASFPAERLAAQQAQILRRLEQLDQPARVIAFPSQTKLEREPGAHRVAAGWLAVAAAAGLVLGVVGGQVTARLGAKPAATTATAPAPPEPVDSAAVLPGGSTLLLDLDLERSSPSSLEAFEKMTPAIYTPKR